MPASPLSRTVQVAGGQDDLERGKPREFGWNLHLLGPISWRAVSLEATVVTRGKASAGFVAGLRNVLVPGANPAPASSACTTKGGGPVEEQWRKCLARLSGSSRPVRRGSTPGGTNVR